MTVTSIVFSSVFEALGVSLTAAFAFASNPPGVALAFSFEGAGVIARVSEDSISITSSTVLNPCNTSGACTLAKKVAALYINICSGIVCHLEPFF